MKCRKLIRKNDYVGIRLPEADKDRLERAAVAQRRDPSDLAWVLIMDGVERIERTNLTQSASPTPNH